MTVVRRESVATLAGLHEPTLLSATQDADRLVQLGACDVDSLARALGQDVEVRTLDVKTGQSGPRWTLAQWALYFNARAAMNGSSGLAAEPYQHDDDSADEVDSAVACDSRAGTNGTNISRQSINRALVVPGISLRGTTFHSSVQLHSAVTEASLLEALEGGSARGAADAQQLQLSMGPATPQQSYTLAPCGGARWLHVAAGSVLARLLPGRDAALSAFVKHHETRGHRPLLQLPGEPVEAVCRPGQALLVPAGWLLSLEYQEPSIALGGVCWRADYLKAHLQCYCIERGLQEHPFTRPSWFLPALWAFALRLTTALLREARLPVLRQRPGARDDLKRSRPQHAPPASPAAAEAAVKERVGRQKSSARQRVKATPAAWIERDEDDRGEDGDEDEADFEPGQSDEDDDEDDSLPSDPSSDGGAGPELSPEPETTSKRRRSASGALAARNGAPRKRTRHSPIPLDDDSAPQARAARRRAPPPPKPEYVYDANPADSDSAPLDAPLPFAQTDSSPAPRRAAAPVEPIARVLRKPGLESEDDWDEDFGKHEPAAAPAVAAAAAAVRARSIAADDELDVRNGERLAEDHGGWDSDDQGADWDSDASLEGGGAARAAAPSKRSRRAEAGAKLKTLVQAEMGEDEEEEDDGADDVWRAGSHGRASGSGAGKARIKLRLPKRRAAADAAAPPDAQAEPPEAKPKIRIRLRKPERGQIQQTDGAADAPLRHRARSWTRAPEPGPCRPQRPATVRGDGEHACLAVCVADDASDASDAPDPAAAQLQRALWRRGVTWRRAGVARGPTASAPSLPQVDGAGDAGEAPAGAAAALRPVERQAAPLIHWFLSKQLEDPLGALPDIPDDVQDPAELLKRLKEAFSDVGLKPVVESGLPYGLKPGTGWLSSRKENGVAPVQEAVGSGDASVGSAGQSPVSKQRAAANKSAPTLQAVAGAPAGSKRAAAAAGAAKAKPKATKVLSIRQRVARMK